MDAIGFFPLLVWALVGAGVVGACIYGFMEYQAFLLRTQVDGIPGGLRFTSRDFSIEAHYGKKELEVQTKNGQFTRKPLLEGEAVVQSGNLTAALPVAGLKMQVFRIVVKDGETPKETGHSTLVFNASDEMTFKAQGVTGGQSFVLRINQVPAAIAADFQRFANTLHTWITKVEGGLAAEVEVLRLAAEAKAKAEAAAAAAAAKPPKEDLSVPLTDAERDARSAAQIAGWREAAGFKGSTSEVSVDPRGNINWFIDLDQRGRITLHSNKRTVHSTLKGAKVTALSGELELSVRDEYWTENEPELTAFRVLSGVAPEVRQAWKERLEIIVQSMVRDAGIGK
jgi:hypothetical protein